MKKVLLITALAVVMLLASGAALTTAINATGRSDNQDGTAPCCDPGDCENPIPISECSEKCKAACGPANCDPADCKKPVPMSECGSKYKSACGPII